MKAQNLSKPITAKKNLFLITQMTNVYIFPKKRRIFEWKFQKKWWVQILTTWREDREMNRWTEWTIITTKQTNISTNGLIDQIDELREMFASMRRWMKGKEPKKKGLTEVRDNGSAQMLQNKSCVHRRCLHYLTIKLYCQPFNFTIKSLWWSMFWKWSDLWHDVT